jgi:hypothetical protein
MAPNLQQEPASARGRCRDVSSPPRCSPARDFAEAGAACPAELYFRNPAQILLALHAERRLGKSGPGIQKPDGMDGQTGRPSAGSPDMAARLHIDAPSRVAARLPASICE